MGGAEDYAGRAPVTVDVRRELAEALNRGQLEGALLPTVQALIADDEKRAAARALREAADGLRRHSVGLQLKARTRFQREARLLDLRAAALDPSGAAEGAGR